MALSQSRGSVLLFIVISSSRPNYGIMASPHSFRISPREFYGPTEFIFPKRSNFPPRDFNINIELFA